mgnify:CR=1 FL=1
MSTALTDQEIKKEIIDRLYWDSRINASDVQVDITGEGNVLLHGTVPSFRALRAAEQDAWGTAGVLSVTNDISVAYPDEAGKPGDDDIRDSIRNSLAWNPVVNEDDIDITASDGTAILEGTVTSLWGKSRVEEIAYDITGVINVVNKLAVVPTDSYSDKNIADRIISVFERNIYIDTEHIDVSVENGYVTVRGTVPSWPVYSTVTTAAKRMQGVVEVKNELKIKKI